jgi:hypothetical protein
VNWRHHDRRCVGSCSSERAVPLSRSSEELTGASRASEDASEGASNAFNPSVIESSIASLRCSSPRRNSISLAIRSTSCDWSSARS